MTLLPAPGRGGAGTAAAARGRRTQAVDAFWRHRRRLHVGGRPDRADALNQHRIGGSACVRARTRMHPSPWEGCPTQAQRWVARTQRVWVLAGGTHRHSGGGGARHSHSPPATATPAGCAPSPTAAAAAASSSSGNSPARAIRDWSKRPRKLAANSPAPPSPAMGFPLRLM